MTLYVQKEELLPASGSSNRNANRNREMQSFKQALGIDKLEEQQRRGLSNNGVSTGLFSNGKCSPNITNNHIGNGLKRTHEQVQQIPGVRSSYDQTEIEYRDMKKNNLLSKAGDMLTKGEYNRPSLQQVLTMSKAEVMDSRHLLNRKHKPEDQMKRALEESKKLYELEKRQRANVADDDEIEIEEPNYLVDTLDKYNPGSKPTGYIPMRPSPQQIHSNNGINMPRTNRLTKYSDLKNSPLPLINENSQDQDFQKAIELSKSTYKKEARGEDYDDMSAANLPNDEYEEYREEEETYSEMLDRVAEEEDFDEESVDGDSEEGRREFLENSRREDDMLTEAFENSMTNLWEEGPKKEEKSPSGRKSEIGFFKEGTKSSRLSSIDPPQVRFLIALKLNF